MRINEERTEKMALAAQPVSRGTSSSSLYDVIDLILDKGLVIDAFVRVSLVGIELITIDARIVVASVDTYLRFAEAVDRLNLRQKSDAAGLPDLAQSLKPDIGGMAKDALPDPVQSAAQKLGLMDDEEEEEAEEEEAKG